jgi:hypothetical protein
MEVIRPTSRAELSTQDPSSSLPVSFFFTKVSQVNEFVAPLPISWALQSLKPQDLQADRKKIAGLADRLSGRSAVWLPTRLAAHI